MLKRILHPFSNSADVSAKDLGQQGETAAANFLKKKKMRILAKNWRAEGALQGYELDIVAEDKGTLVFVEVKTRSADKDIPIYTAFSKQKQSKVVKAAQLYLHSTDNWDYPCRFDLICVCGTDYKNFTIKHYEHVIEIR